MLTQPHYPNRDKKIVESSLHCFPSQMKSLNKLLRWFTWGLSFPLMVLNGWLLIIFFEYFHSLITIFIIATLLAFILNYPVQFLTSHQVKQNIAVFGVIVAVVLLVGILGVTLAPIVFGQLNELANRLPTWIESGSQQLQTLNDWALIHNLPLNLSGLTTQLTERLSTQLQSLTGEVIGLIVGTVGSVLDLLLTSVLTFYLLLHGDQLWSGIFQWLPEPIGLHVRPLLRQNFHNYYIGQVSLAAIIGVSMMVAFSVLRVPFSLLFGLVIGLMALFPFGAALSICLVSLLVALKSFWLGVRVLIVAIVLEQIIENGIAPRLLGGFTGLNPVWILVSLLIGTKVGGILGLLIAVPIAGFIKSTAMVMRPATSNFSSLETDTPTTQDTEQ